MAMIFSSPHIASNRQDRGDVSCQVVCDGVDRKSVAVATRTLDWTIRLSTHEKSDAIPGAFQWNVLFENEPPFPQIKGLVKADSLS